MLSKNIGLTKCSHLSGLIFGSGEAELWQSLKGTSTGVSGLRQDCRMLRQIEEPSPEEFSDSDMTDRWNQECVLHSPDERDWWCKRHGGGGNKRRRRRRRTWKDGGLESYLRLTAPKGRDGSLVWSKTIQSQAITASIATHGLKGDPDGWASKLIRIKSWTKAVVAHGRC